MFTHILVPTDGTELSATAARQAAGLAHALGARLTAVHVTAPYHPTEMTPSVFTTHAGEHDAQARSRAERALGAVGEIARAAGVACTAVHRVAESAAEGIVALASEAGCDLVVMASHGRRGVTALLLGSETSKVLALARIPVLVVR
jgi:nucleotide-binding universal stress UspA family protein